MEKGKRIEYMDGMRGMAVIAMFFVHSASAWLALPKSGAYWAWMMRLSGIVAPVFMFLVGISVFVARRKYEDGTRAGDLAAVGEKAAGKAFCLKLALRGAKLIALGYALHFVFWILRDFSGAPERVFRVDILHAIGLSLIILPSLTRSKGWFNWPALAIFLALPLLGHVFFRLSPEKALPEALAAYITVKSELALFPFVPYAAWVSLGLFVGPIWARTSIDAKREKYFLLGLVVAAAAMYLAGRGLKIVYYAFYLDRGLSHENQIKGLIHLFLTKGAVVLLFFAAFQATKAMFEYSWAKPILLLGKTSLFAYCVHLIVVWNIAGRFFHRSLSPGWHLLAASVLSLVILALCAIWNRRSIVKRDSL